MQCSALTVSLGIGLIRPLFSVLVVCLRTPAPCGRVTKLVRFWSRAALAAALFCGIVPLCAHAEAPLLQVPEESLADAGVEEEVQPNVAAESNADGEDNSETSGPVVETPPTTLSDSFFSKLN